MLTSGIPQDPSIRTSSDPRPIINHFDDVLLVNRSALQGIDRGVVPQTLRFVRIWALWLLGKATFAISSQLSR
jgi:hypothetical protein